MQSIMWPKHFPDIRRLSGHMHDLETNLKNPNPHEDWKQGDIAWVYIPNEKAIMVGCVTTVWNTAKTIELQDIDNTVRDSHSKIISDFTDLFSNYDDLMHALYHIDDNITASQSQPATRYLLMSSEDWTMTKVGIFDTKQTAYDEMMTQFKTVAKLEDKDIEQAIAKRKNNRVIYIDPDNNLPNAPWFTPDNAYCCRKRTNRGWRIIEI